MAEIGVSSILTTEYLVPIFLGTIFLASLLAFKIKIPYTMVLLGIGIGISVVHLAGAIPFNIGEFKVDPKLILYFIVPPLIYEAMMRIDREKFRAIRISAL